jgi:hypothetical protein
MCNCNPEKVDYPQNYEWGPRIWNVLHGLSLRAGTNQIMMMRDDEMRTWEKIITSTGPMLPCEECRGHYAGWLASHPVKPLSSLGYSEKGDWIRRWFYDLHTSVNQRLGKQNLAYEELRGRYANVNISDELKTLDGLITRALKVGGGTSLLKYREWLKHIAMVRSFY